MSGRHDAVAVVQELIHRYGSVTALDGISTELPAGRLVGLIGPDGVGNPRCFRSSRAPARSRTAR